MAQYVKAERIGSVCNVTIVTEEDVDELSLYSFQTFFKRLREEKDIREGEAIYARIYTADQVTKLCTLDSHEIVQKKE